MKESIDDKANEINAIPILSDRDYDWVWDYARFRLDKSISDLSKAEEKGQRLATFAISGFGAFWGLFLYFDKDLNLPLAGGLNILTILGLVSLFATGFCGVSCMIPVGRLLPYGEDIAVRFINEQPAGSRRPRGAFALCLKLCTDVQDVITTRKARFVLIGFIFLGASLILLFAGFYRWMLLA